MLSPAVLAHSEGEMHIQLAAFDPKLCTRVNNTETYKLILITGFVTACYCLFVNYSLDKQDLFKNNKP